MSVTHCKRQKQVRVVEDVTWDKGRGILFLDKTEVGYILHKGNVTVSTGTGLIFMNLNIQIRKKHEVALWRFGTKPALVGWHENMRQDGPSQDNPDIAVQSRVCYLFPAADLTENTHGYKI